MDIVVRASFAVILLVICVLTLGTGCEAVSGYDSRFKVVNNSGRAIYVEKSYTFPDTSIPPGSPMISPIATRVEPGKELGIPILCCWEAKLEEVPSHMVMLFVFDADTVDLLPWDRVRREYKILRRYDLTIEDLRQLNWTITYP